MRYFLSVLFCLALPAMLCAQGKKERKPGDEMIEKYLAAETDKLSAKFLDGAKTIDEWKQKRPRLYQEYMDMLGLWPIPEKTPLKATITGTVEAHGVVVEKLHFQSKPGLYVTANLYRPKAQGRESLGRFPAIVYVCGHTAKGRDGNKSAFQDHGFWFANNGYVCIVLDTLQLGEIPGVHHGTYGRPWFNLEKYGMKEKDKLENRFWWHSIGYSPAAVECWNGVRAIDYLCTRADVDPDKIGVTGISGGGAATFWIAAADDRVKVAVPVSGMADLESYVKDKVILGHCDCMFLYNSYQWHWTTIAALVAPRPLLFANSGKDSIFPMDANRRVFARLQMLYEMYDTPNAQGRKSLGLQEHVSPGGHAYRPDLRVAVFRFFNVHLKGDKTSKVEDSAKYTPLNGPELRVFPEDKDVPKDALNGRIDETFIPAAKVTLPEKGKFDEWKKGMIAKLRQQSFAGFPTRIPPALEKDGGGLFTTYYKTEKNIHAGIICVKQGKDGSRTATVLVNNWDDENLKELRKLRVRVRDEWVWSVSDRNNLEVEHNWTRKSPPNFVERTHALLGRTVDTGAVFDIISMLRLCEADFANGKGPRLPEGERHWRLVGGGQNGIIAAYAALFEPSIKEVVVVDPPKSHKEGPYFLNVMRVLDIPEALGLLAPTPLTIIGGLDPAFDRTAEIYRLAGAADKLTRK